MTAKEKRTAIANEILAWLVARGETKGQFTYFVIRPFALEKNYEMPNCWKAWALLQDNQRVTKQKGPGWEILDSTPLKLPEKLP